MVRRRTCPGPRSDRRRHGARGEAYTWVVAVRHPGPPTLEIARALGVSRAHVSRMLRRALEHLRTLDAADAA